MLKRSRSRPRRRLHEPAGYYSKPAVRSFVGQARGRLDRADWPTIVQRYQAGESTQELADVFGVAQTTIADLLEKHGVPRRRVLAKFDDAMTREAVELYEQGWSTHRLGRHFQTSPPTVTKALRSAGVRIRLRGRPLA